MGDIEYVGWIFEMLLVLAAVPLYLSFPGVRKKGHLYLEEEIAWGLWAFTGFLFHYVLSEEGHLFPWGVMSRFPITARIAEKALFLGAILLAIKLQRRANVKKSDDGPVHPRDKPYEGGGQTYLWDDED